eukprot:CAMPEP_0177690520 /NCGR_PEP_ID=MMETSP0484_2-20121128/810_1 /TAXON_ID=354590 /ORGANISM="Rhodomonas lens, Strain RHODO" /LENGTH=96 /DNA_ID=CAMNT_0019201069 /DNA_START=49 /DNA_END=340 /DNA_ORIENTATION=-
MNSGTLDDDGSSMHHHWSRAMLARNDSCGERNDEDARGDEEGCCMQDGNTASTAGTASGGTCLTCRTHAWALLPSSFTTMSSSLEDWALADGCMQR